MARKTAKTKRQNEAVYVIAGKEATLVNSRYTELVDRLIAPEEKATGLLAAEADKISISDVLDELRTLPFLTKKRVVAVRNADKFVSANREMLETYFEAPCPTGILILTVSNWPKNTKLAKKLPRVGTLIEVKPPKGSEIPRRLIDYAHDAHSKRLEYGAARLLVELAGDDITRLYTEIDKLATYAADEKAIKTSHVEVLVGYNRMFNAFAVIEACLYKKTVEAVERLRKMFSEDKNADYTTVGAFAYHFRNLFTAKKLIEEGDNPYTAAGKARIWYNKEAQLALLRRLTLRQLGGYLKQLAETDYAIKKGLAQPRIAIEQLVLQMTAM